MSDIIAQLQLREAQRVNDALHRAKELRESHGLHFYRPHFKQHRFHEMGQVTGRYCRFGNRTGKTVCGSAEDIAWLYGGRMWYRSSFDILGTEQDENGVWVKKVVGRHEGRKDHPLVTLGIPQRSVKGLLVVSSWSKAKEIFTGRTSDYDSDGELFQLIPRAALDARGIHTTQGNIDAIEINRPEEFGGGTSILYIATVEAFKHAWRAAESSDFDFIHYDEPPPQRMFIANKRGLTDRNGKFWVNATPVEELWVNDEFCPPKSNNLTVAVNGLAFKKNGGERFIITATIWDNPYIDDEGRTEFLSSLSREEVECRAKGLPLNLAGLIYKEFIYDIHVLCDVPKGWLAYDRPPLSYTTRVAWDVHDAIPQAVLFAATAPSGEVFIYDEMYFSRLIDENAKELKDRLEDRFVADYVIDPKAVIESPVTGMSILDVLMDHDLYFEKGSKDMDLGISKTREKFSERRETPQGPMPTIYVTPACVTLIHEIMRYAYNPKTMRPVDKDDHMCENLRRLVLTGLAYVAPPKDSDWVRPNHNISMDELSLSRRS